MRLKFFIALLALGALTVGVHTHAHSQEVHFDVGGTAGMASWETEEKETGFNGGIVARLTVPLGTNVYAGIHGVYSVLESAEYTESASVYVRGIEVRASGTAEVDNSLDLLARIGFHLEGADGAGLYLAAGLSRAETSASLSVSAAGASVSDSGSATLTGHKIAAGIDFPLGDNFTSFIQLEHADYGDDTITLFGLPIDFDLKAMGLRFGALYRF